MPAKYYSHQESFQPSAWTVCFGYFKFSTCSSLLIGCGHSTRFRTQILIQLWLLITYNKAVLLVLEICTCKCEGMRSLQRDSDGVVGRRGKNEVHDYTCLGF